MARRRKIGKIREKLAEMLQAKGFMVQPEDFWIQEGVYRHFAYDGARWGAYWHPKKGSQLVYSIYSWDTMTECVRTGIVVMPDDTPCHFEVHSGKSCTTKEGVTNGQEDSSRYPC